MAKYSMKLEGTSPLLMHFDNIEAQDGEGVRGKTGGKAGDDRYPADKWKSYLYLDPEHVVMPGANILASLLKVGSSISIGGKKTLKTASQGVLFDDIFLDFRCGHTMAQVARKDVEEIDGSFDDQRRAVRPLGFTINVAPCRVAGKRHIRTRPMFEMWQVTANFETTDDDLTAPRLDELFNIAGIKSGLGDWRPGSPSKPGAYGRFTAKIKPIH